MKTGHKWAGLEDIYCALTDLMEAAELEEAEPGLGYLTSQDRRSWAEAYTKLGSVNEKNKVSCSLLLFFD